MNHSPIAGPPPERSYFFRGKFAAVFFFLAAVFALVSARAQMFEYAIPTSSALPESIVAAPDGAYWYTEFNANRIGRVDTNGVVTEPFVFARDTGPFRMIVGPDTNLWFSESHADTIARVSRDTNGNFTVFTEFLIHTNVVTNCQPSGITFGPDGNIWFLEYIGNMVGKMSTNGVLLREYGSNFFRTNMQAYNIAVGSDNALWFTEVTYGTIGRIDTLGNLSEFNTPYTNCEPLDIISGPDGALWFTEINSNRVGRFTTAGAYSDFILPTVGILPEFNFSQVPYRLTTGSDGNIWFTEYVGGNIDRLDIRATNFVATGTNTTNFITEFPTPTPGSGPTGIASGGRDKGIWFAEYNANAVGQFLVPTLTISVNTNSQFVLTWPVTATDYILQGNTNLNGTNWINLTSPPPIVVGNTLVYTNTVTNLDFFRLFLNAVP